MNPQKVYSVHGFFPLISGGSSAVSGEALLQIIARGAGENRGKMVK
jgi:hypothetical protein